MASLAVVRFKKKKKKMMASDVNPKLKLTRIDTPTGNCDLKLGCFSQVELLTIVRNVLYQHK